MLEAVKRPPIRALLPQRYQLQTLRETAHGVPAALAGAVPELVDLTALLAPGEPHGLPAMVAGRRWACWPPGRLGRRRGMHDQGARGPPGPSRGVLGRPRQAWVQVRWVCRGRDGSPEGAVLAGAAVSWGQDVAGNAVATANVAAMTDRMAILCATELTAEA